MSGKESVPELSDLVVTWDVIVVLWFFPHTVSTKVLSDKPGYKSSLMGVVPVHDGTIYLVETNGTCYWGSI